MRRSWPADFVSIRQTAVESAVLTTVGLVAALLLTQRSYEAAVTIDQAAIAQAGAARFIEVARLLSSQDPQAQPVRLGAVVLGPDTVRVTCRSENARRAQDACSHVVTEATRSTSARIDFASSPVQAPDRTFRFVVSALVLGLLWLAFRINQRREELRAQTQDELQAWSVARPDVTASENVPQIAPSFRVPTLGARRTATMPGISDVAPAIALENAELVHPTNESDASAEIRPPIRHSRAVPAAGRDAGDGLKTKVVYRVGSNPFRPDKSVLKPSTLAQLREQRDLMLAEGSGHQVVRIASDVGSRYAKTQTAAQLACLLAEQADSPVLLLEADSDAPALHKVLRLEAPPGLGFSEQLQRLNDRGKSGTVSVVRMEGNLHVLTESRVSCPEAFGVELFADVLAELRKGYKHIIVDGPVIDVWPDVAHLAHGMDALIMVTAAGTRAHDPLSLVARHFPAEMLIGVVAAGDWSATG